MNNTKFWIALEQAEGIGPAHLKEIYDSLEALSLSIIDIFDLSDQEIENEFSFNKTIREGFAKARIGIQSVEEEYFEVIDAGVEIVPFFSKKYPQRLKDIMNKAIPPFLYCYGNCELMNESSVAILGDKDISNRGAEITFFAAQELVRHRINVVSGYASGADMIAHRSAIVSGGTTAAVIPSGIKFFKPHESIKEQATFDNLLIISPFFPTVEVNQFNAYIRNRICCALSRAVYIVEAPVEGGIFEAAKSAQKLNIPLYTTRYSSYPENAKGNEKILSEMNGQPISRKSGDVLQPNIDKIIAHAKFDE